MDTESVRDVGSRGASVAERAQVRPITNEEGNRLLRILRRGTGSVVTWHRAQMVMLSAQAMDVPQIARVTFTSEDRVRDVLHNFNADGFESLYPRYKGGRPPKFTEQQRDEIKRIALSRPEDHDVSRLLPALVLLARSDGEIRVAELLRNACASSSRPLQRYDGRGCDGVTSRR
jgi:transposase